MILFYLFTFAEFYGPRGALLFQCSKYMKAEEECVMSLTDEQKSHLIKLENGIIDAICGELCSSAMYICTFQIGDKYYSRWLDLGTLKGSAQHLQTRLMPLNYEQQRRSVWWQVLTQNDVDNQMKRPVGKGRRWKNTIFSNQKSVRNSFSQLSSSSASVVGIAIRLKKSGSSGKLNVSDDEFHADFGTYSGCSELVSSFVLHGTDISTHAETFDDLVGKFTREDFPLSSVQQATIINSIDNDSTPRGRTGVSTCQYFSTGTGNITVDEDGEEHITSKYIPTSKRNKLLYFYRLGKVAHAIDLLQLQGNNMPGGNSRSRASVEPQNVSRTSAVRLSNNPPSDHHVEVDVEVDTPPSSNPSDFQPIDQTPFVRFVQHLISDGVIHWRIHSGDLDIIAMNDINLDSISFQKNKFVHICRNKCPHFNDVSYFCNCQMQTLVSDMNEDSVCCHIRFMRLYVEPMYDKLFDQTSIITQTRLNVKIQRSLQSLNVPVIRLDHDHVFHRFSVMSEDMHSCSIVKLNGHRFSCSSGKCVASAGHSRKIKNINDDVVCEHLKTIHHNRDQWKCLCQDVDDNDDNDDDDDDDDDGHSELHDIENNIDHLICQNASADPHLTTGNFDQSTGLWTFPSTSNHPPRKQDDPLLFSAKLIRLDALLSPGKYIEVSPRLDESQICGCGSKYFSDEYPSGKVTRRYESPVKLYTENGILNLIVCDRQCLSEIAACVIEYSGEQDSIHILSRYTAAGDEIGWDYVNHVMNSAISFSGYCNIVNARYPLGESFMSRQTFIDFIFSWMANFKTDFREVCQVCGPNPQVLACDGTKLGIFLKNSSVTPIESATTARSVQQQHSRSQRQFFHYSKESSSDIKQAKHTAQQDLLFFVSKVLGKPHSGNCNRTEDQRKEHVLLHTPARCKDMMRMFLESVYHHDLMLALCPILKLFASYYPLSSLVNYRFLESVSDTLTSMDTLNTSIIQQELPEMYRVLQAALAHEQTDSVVQCFKYVIDRIYEIHQHDPQPSPAAILEDYNPLEQGRAYYFTPHGGRVRDMPNYSCNDKNSTSEGPTTCRKKFVDATKTGMTFLFLWFDPLHGHCYGFHVVPGSEGRKDPFSSAYLYMQQPPSEVFYDFSCQLEEYSLNREPGFWRNCRFFHDIFHGFSHKCPDVYSAKRIPLIHTRVNTEVCEQFNSFAQKIKYSARAMSQPHFMFFLQFFIHRWNLLKQQKIQQQRHVALSLLE